MAPIRVRRRCEWRLRWRCPSRIPRSSIAPRYACLQPGPKVHRIRQHTRVRKLVASCLQPHPEHGGKAQSITLKTRCGNDGKWKFAETLANRMVACYFTVRVMI